jgi:hypothetical protein
MFDCEEDKRRILQPGYLSVFLGIGNTRSTICQEATEFVARDDEHANIETPISKGRC